MLTEKNGDYLDFFKLAGILQQASFVVGNDTGPMHMAANAMQIFHAGRTKYPDGDNWICARVIEEIVGEIVGEKKLRIA